MIIALSHEWEDREDIVAAIKSNVNSLQANTYNK